VRIGVVSDIHHELPPRPQRRWINDFEPEAVMRRLGEALAGFDRAAVDLVLLLGDLTHDGDERALDEVLVALEGRRAAAVPGNHDGASIPAGLQPHGVAALSAGFGAGELFVAVSHFPLLSERERLEAAGLPYAGDRPDREEALAALRRPAVVLSGHIHARTSRVSDGVLQLTVGALIEPPFEATIVELADGTVTRSARRLGPRPERDPVFAPDEERWTWSPAGWERA
jgi:predicted phosphodiesterase